MGFDETGERLTPTYFVKEGTRYPQCFDLPRHRGRKEPFKQRADTASNLEGLVINRLRTFLADPGAILDALDNESHSGLDQLIERGRQIEEHLGAHAPDTDKAMFVPLLCRVEIRSDRVDMTLSRCRVAELLVGSIDLTRPHQGPTNSPGYMLRLTVPAGLMRVCREMRMLIENSDDPDTR